MVGLAHARGCVRLCLAVGRIAELLYSPPVLLGPHVLLLDGLGHEVAIALTTVMQSAPAAQFGRVSRAVGLKTRMYVHSPRQVLVILRGARFLGPVRRQPFELVLDPVQVLSAVFERGTATHCALLGARPVLLPGLTSHPAREEWRGICFHTWPSEPEYSMAEGRARIREMRVDREIQLVRQADLPCNVTVDDEAVFLRTEAAWRPVVVEISFPAAYPFMAPSVRVVEGKEALGGKHTEGDPSLELSSLQSWTPSTQVVELAREVIEAVAQLANAAAGQEKDHPRTRRVAPAPEPADEPGASPPSRAAIGEPYYRPGEGAPFAALEQVMTFSAVHRVYAATEREELRCDSNGGRRGRQLQAHLRLLLRRARCAVAVVVCGSHRLPAPGTSASLPSR